MRRILLGAAAFAVVACSPARNGGNEGTPDAGNPGGTGLPATEPACTTALDTSKTFTLDTDGQVQIGAHAAFDGTVWVAYSRAGADGSGGFDVVATRIGCDGSTIMLPFPVSTGVGSNDVDPFVAVGTDRVLVTWSGDDSNSSPNLSVRYREIGLDGSRLTDEEAILATTKPDGSIADDANAWMPSALALENGRFAIAGSRGFLNTPGGFRAFVHHVGGDGLAEGNTVDAAVPNSGSEEHPGLARAKDGSYLLAWAHSYDELPSIVETAKMPESGAISDPGNLSGSRSGEYPTVASAPWAPYSFVAYQSALEGLTSVVIRDLAQGADGPSLELSSPAAGSYGPVVAVAKDGGAAAWFAQKNTGVRAIFAQSFSFDGHSFTEGSLVQVSANGAAIGPYKPAIVHVSGKTYFVAWSEGTHPDIQVKARFVELP